MAARTKRGATAESRRLATMLRRVIALVERNAQEIEKLRDDMKVQFSRSAQLQAELDAIKKAWEKMQSAV